VEFVLLEPAPVFKERFKFWLPSFLGLTKLLFDLTD